MTTDARKRDIDKAGIVNLISVILTALIGFLALYVIFTERKSFYN